MLTRCPRCDTTFRVTPEQLKARQGRVRCGSCQAVFNALETLVDEVVVAEPPVPAAVPAAEPPAPPAASTEELDAWPPLPAEPHREPEPAPEPLNEPWPLPADFDRVAAEVAAEVAANAAAAAAVEPAVEAANLKTLEPLPAPPLPAEPETSVAADATEPEAEAPVASPDPAAAADAVREPEFDKPPAGAPEAFEALPEPLPPREPEAESADEPWPGPEPLLHEDEQPRRRWPWVVGSILVLAALGLQVAIHNRVELAVIAPETKPALLAACELFGCELSLPRKIELIGIETSDLHPDPAAEQRLGLTATLRNRAPFAQVWPALELTLTDKDDKALVRRVLQANEYLPEKISPTAGFPANSDQAINLAIDAKDVAAVGYRLYVFYP